MNKVYDLNNDKKGIKQIQDKIKKGLSGYRTHLGLFGSVDWFENLKKNNLIEIINGEISDVFKGGHNDFPMFSIFDGKSTYQFEIKGAEKFYIKGKKIHFEGVRNENVRPSSGLEKLLIPLKIEIE
jgi:hypothetical protein